GEFLSGNITEKERSEIVRKSCPGAGACGGMYTANTMASAIEVMGMTLPGSSSNPAESKAKQLECWQLVGQSRSYLRRIFVPATFSLAKHSKMQWCLSISREAPPMLYSIS